MEKNLPANVISALNSSALHWSKPVGMQRHKFGKRALLLKAASQFAVNLFQEAKRSASKLTWCKNTPFNYDLPNSILDEAPGSLELYLAAWRCAKLHLRLHSGNY